MEISEHGNKGEQEYENKETWGHGSTLVWEYGNT